MTEKYIDCPCCPGTVLVGGDRGSEEKPSVPATGELTNPVFGNIQ